MSVTIEQIRDWLREYDFYASHYPEHEFEGLSAWAYLEARLSGKSAFEARSVADSICVGDCPDWPYFVPWEYRQKLGTDHDMCDPLCKFVYEVPTREEDE